MRKLTIRLIFLTLGMAAASFALLSRTSAEAEKHDRDQAAILEALKNQQVNWNKGDVDAFLEGYWHSPELTFAGTSGIARGWDAVRARYKKNYADREAMGQLEFSALEFRFLGPMRLSFWATGIWRVPRETLAACSRWSGSVFRRAGASFTITPARRNPQSRTRGFYADNGDALGTACSPRTPSRTACLEKTSCAAPI